jgi:hypothetical protein
LPDRRTYRCLRVTLRLLVTELVDHPLLATEREVGRKRKELSKGLEKWRDSQAVHMPSVMDIIECQDAYQVEDEPLLLPSSFPAIRQEELGIVTLASEEARLREGQACDLILQLRRVAKTISALHSQRKKNDKHQKQQTRSRSRIQAHELARDGMLATYIACRKALGSLGCIDDDLSERRFPPLTLDDLRRHSTVRKRGIGDSRRADGDLWVATAVGMCGDALYPLAEAEEYDTSHGERGECL